MRNWLAKIWPESWLLRRLLMLTALAVACFGAFCWGRRQAVVAQPAGNPSSEFGQRISTQDYDRRIVAYLYTNEPVTRAELGEYLIARFGPERLEFLVNRKIVEMEGRKKNVFVTDAEVEDRFAQDLRSFGNKGVSLTQKDFETQILRRFNKTLYEWKEDVVRPKILMEKIVTPMVTVTEQDVQDGFEAQFGPKVQCRMIVVEPHNSAVVHAVWQEARQGPPQFMAKAATQGFIPNLAAEKGKVPAIHKHFGDKKLEDAAFRLRVNEVSEPILMPDGTSVILLCEEHILAKTDVRYENERMRIQREVQEMRIAQKIPEVFKEMRERAQPRLVLDNAVSHVARVEPQTGTGLRAFDQIPSSVPSLPQTQPPVPTPLTVPGGYQPTALPNVPPAPPVLPNIVLPNLSNIEKK